MDPAAPCVRRATELTSASERRGRPRFAGTRESRSTALPAPGTGTGCLLMFWLYRTDVFTPSWFMKRYSAKSEASIRMSVNPVGTVRAADVHLRIDDRTRAAIERDQELAAIEEREGQVAAIPCS